MKFEFEGELRVFDSSPWDLPHKGMTLNDETVATLVWQELHAWPVFRDETLKYGKWRVTFERLEEDAE